MITVLEGPSAVGKTSLLRQVPSGQVVSEDWGVLGFPQQSWPDLYTAEGQSFGVTLNSHRWELLREAEENYGSAYADTDPLKLYYNFALALHGSLSRDQLLVTLQTSRQAMAVEQLGFADRVVFLNASSQSLWSRKQQDVGRRRGKFALHVQLIDAFADYYRMLEQVRPGTVTIIDTNQREVSSTLLTHNSLIGPEYFRYDMLAFEALQQHLLDYFDNSILRSLE